MPVPAVNISNTVLRRPLPLVHPSIFPMYITSLTSPWEDVEVYVENGTEVVKQAVATYDISINPVLYWQFTFTWTGTPPTGTNVVIFRRVRGVVIPLDPGAFLSAEALNQRFNLENLGINDLQYYQQKTNPSYSAQAIVEHGTWDPLAPDSNPALPDDDLQLPYLGTGTLLQGEIYTWGKKIDNIVTGAGEFQQVLIKSPGGSGTTVAQFKASLSDCSSSADAGGNLVGVWSAANPAIGWTGGCLQVQPWFENMSKSGSAADAGGNQVGLYIDNLIPQKAGPVSVQGFANRLSEPGIGPYTVTSGAADIGYGGWSLPGVQTVASCLSRLNDPATSAADSGAAYVQWWTGTQSQSVQDALEHIAGGGGWTSPAVPHTSPMSFTWSAFPAPFNDPTKWLKLEVMKDQSGIALSNVNSWPDSL